MKIISAFLCAVLMPVTVYAAEGTQLPDNPWERIAFVYNKVCHMPAGMIKILTVLAVAIIATVSYYFIFVSGKVSDGGEDNG